MRPWRLRSRPGERHRSTPALPAVHVAIPCPMRHPALAVPASRPAEVRLSHGTAGGGGLLAGETEGGGGEGVSC